jgi:hypothetical protein
MSGRAWSWQHSKVNYPGGTCEISSRPFIGASHRCQLNDASSPSARLA